MSGDNDRVMLRGMSVWLLIIVAETVHGIARGLLLVPLVGDLRARQIGVFTGTLIIFAIAFMTIRWINSPLVPRLLLIGIVWVGLTSIFEVGFGLALGFSLERILSDYDIRAGGLMLAGLLFMLFAPYLSARLRGAV